MCLGARHAVEDGYAEVATYSTETLVDFQATTLCYVCRSKSKAIPVTGRGGL
jgi:hypothetical protein